MVDWNTPHEVQLWPKKPARTGSERRHYYLYDVTYQGRVIVSDSIDPECAAARALPDGITGWVVVRDGRTGKRRSAFHAAACRDLRVSEEDRGGLRFKKWTSYKRRPDDGQH